MRRFTVVTALFTVSILAVWGIFEAFAASPSGTASGNAPIEVRVETDEMLKASQSGASAVPMVGTDMKIAPVFDATGASISDPTGTMLNANQSEASAVPMVGADMKIAPVFDATGAIISDPTGTMLNANQSGSLVVPVTGTDMKVAPVFDATGAVVSDPTGTLLSVVNP